MRICPKCGKKYPDTIVFCPLDGQELLAEERDSPRSPEPLRLGNRVLGQYRLEEVLAEGGMGIVFSAMHVKLGRRVALKMLRPEFADNKKAITRFFREARAVNEIQHENIIEITDFIEDQDGENYYIMELLQGQDLRQLLLKEGPLSVPRALSISIQVANSLAAVHRAGIVHRDLKTENIFLQNKGENPDFVKLLDFGVAKLIRHVDEDDLHKTVEGTILGTAEYMSPEQASGKAVDFRTDIYSLGVILYEMLTGRRPISGKSFSEVIYNQLMVTPTKPSRLKGINVSLPVHLEELIMQCLEKDPEVRPQSMEETEARLRNIGREGSVRCETASRRLFVSPRARWRPLLALGAVLLLGAGMAAFFLPGGEQARSEVKSAAGPEPMSAGESPPAPAEPSTPAEAETVEIRFESAPPGAAVYGPGGTGPLGATPLTLSFRRGGSVRLFEFRLKGHQPARRKVSMAENGVVSIALLPAGKHARPKKKRHHLDTGGTVDPFEEE